MKKLIMYGISSAIIFNVGSCYQKNKSKELTLNQKYYTLQKEKSWYLSTPEGVKIINKNHQVGTVEERMGGLLKDEYEVLKNSLEKIIKKDDN